ALVAARALSPAQALMLSTRELGELAIGARLATGPGSPLSRSHAPHPFGKATTILQYAAVTAALFGRRYVDAFVSAAADAGVLASAAYWLREARADAASFGRAADPRALSATPAGV